jgi:hypothetical protein
VRTNHLTRAEERIEVLDGRPFSTTNLCKDAAANRSSHPRLRPSIKTAVILIELFAIIVLAGWLYSDYENNPYMRQYINSFLQGTQQGHLLQQLAGIGTSFVLPLRLLVLSLLSMVTVILMLLLLFMFATFLASVITGRGRLKK